MEDVHQLALIFVKPLDLHVENGARVHVNTVVLFDVPGEAQLVLVLDVHELKLALLILCKELQLLDMGKVGNPFITYLGSDPVRQKGVAVKQEPSLGYAVCLVVELLRHHLIEVF